MDGAVKRDYDPFAHVLRTPSPSVNFIFGGAHGLPLGYSAILSGLPKSGKSLLINAFMGQLHKDDPDAICLKFDSEMREGTTTDRQLKVWGIDPERYQGYSTNQPHEIFDKIENEVNALCQAGAPIRLIAIDSMTGIVGRRSMDSETILDQQRGDEALTITTGLKRILPCIRRNRIALLMTTHVRAEQDPMKAKYVPHKMAAPFALKHFSEYFITVSQNTSAEGKKDLSGNEFVDESVKDLMDKNERTGHKIRVTMAESSVGVPGRVGELTLDYDRGIINQHEELFKLATKRGVVPLEGKSFIVKDFPEKGEDQKYIGRDNFANAIKNNEFLYAELEKRIRAIDEDAMRFGRSATGPGLADMTGDDEESSATEG